MNKLPADAEEVRFPRSQIHAPRMVGWAERVLKSGDTCHVVHRPFYDFPGGLVTSVFSSCVFDNATAAISIEFETGSEPPAFGRWLQDPQLIRFADHSTVTLEGEPLLTTATRLVRPAKTEVQSRFFRLMQVSQALQAHPRINAMLEGFPMWSRLLSQAKDVWPGVGGDRE